MAILLVVLGHYGCGIGVEKDSGIMVAGTRLLWLLSLGYDGHYVSIIVVSARLLWCRSYSIMMVWCRGYCFYSGYYMLLL